MIKSMLWVLTGNHKPRTTCKHGTSGTSRAASRCRIRNRARRAGCGSKPLQQTSGSPAADPTTVRAPGRRGAAGRGGRSRCGRRGRRWPPQVATANTCAIWCQDTGPRGEGKARSELLCGGAAGLPWTGSSAATPSRPGMCAASRSTDRPRRLDYGRGRGPPNARHDHRAQTAPAASVATRLGMVRSPPSCDRGGLPETSAPAGALDRNGPSEDT